MGNTFVLKTHRLLSMCFDFPTERKQPRKGGSVVELQINRREGHSGVNRIVKNVLDDILDKVSEPHGFILL